MENILTQRRRDDVLEISQQTMAGKTIVKPKKLPRLVGNIIMEQKNYLDMSMNISRHLIMLLLMVICELQRSTTCGKYSKSDTKKR